jgi:hypothetical protein
MNPKHRIKEVSLEFRWKTEVRVSTAEDSAVVNGNNTWKESDF